MYDRLGQAGDPLRGRLPAARATGARSAIGAGRGRGRDRGLIGLPRDPRSPRGLIARRPQDPLQLMVDL